jgi:Contact-dependent growth inhibition CdiA C-terminal domain
VSTLTVEALEYAGMSPMAAELTNAGVGLVGTVGPGAVRAVAAGRAAQVEEVAALGRNANDMRPFEMPDGPSPGVFEDIANAQREAGLRPYVSEVAVDETTTPGAVTGTETRIRPQDDAATTRSLIRENETAEQLAEAGYDVERNPSVPGSKEPDYLVNGEVFDCYAPDTANVRNIWSEVEDKINKGQAERVVINLADSTASVREVIGQFSDFPIPGLRELFIFDQNGNLTVLNWKKGK